MIYSCSRRHFQRSFYLVIPRTPPKHLSFALLSVLLCTSLFSGCLTAEKKEVRLTLKDDGKSGTGRIIFTGISSSPGDSASAIERDFNSLIVEYYQGRKIELANPGMTNVHKKLFMHHGKLIGEIDFDFRNISDLGLRRYKNSGPYMYYTMADGFLVSGQYESSNGTYLGDKLPVIFWDSTERDFSYTMSLSSPQEPKHSLLADFERWEAGQQ